MEQLLGFSEHDTISDSELTSLMQCALVGGSRTPMVDALVGGLHTGQDQASPKTCLHIAMRLVPNVWLLSAGIFAADSVLQSCH